MTQISTIGLDIAKNSFAVHGFDAGGKTVLKKTLKRAQVLPFFAGHAAARVGLEACASAHHWARELAKLGHEVKLVPAARVKAFRITVTGITVTVHLIIHRNYGDSAFNYPRRAGVAIAILTNRN